jgi:catecholate siderophore receptor
VENVAGADYFATAHNDNNIAPGAPRTLRGTLRFRF